MRSRIAAFVAVFVLLCSQSPFSFAAGTGGDKDLSKVNAIQKLNALNKGKADLNESNGQVFLSGKLSGKQQAGEKSARGFLKEYQSLLGIENTEDELTLAETRKSVSGGTLVRFRQLIGGIPVEGSMLNVHFDKNGVIVSVNGNIQKDKTITHLGKGAISEGEAVEIAKKQYKYDSLRETPKAERMITAKGGKNYDVYKVNIAYMSPEIANYDVYVEAHTGKVVRTESNIRYDGSVTGTGVDVTGKTRSLDLYMSGSTYKMDNIVNPSSDEILTLTMYNGSTYGYDVTNTTGNYNSEEFKAPVSAHYFADVVVDFYRDVLNRNSLDGQHMEIDSYTHYKTGYNNAFWDGAEMVYGDGDGVTFTYLSGDLDVVGHEMTHGVVSNTANLVYHFQPGALNESVADTFGVLIETYDKYAVATGGTWAFNAADWVVGDEIYTPGIPGDALRNLADPHNGCSPGESDWQPAKMSEYVRSADTEDGDWGGVHTNSGIPNKAAYLIAQAIGMEKTAQLYYAALVDYMGPMTDFAGARYCLVQAAARLFGAGSAEAAAVNSAFDSVGISPPVEDPYEPNDSLDTAYAITPGTEYRSYIAQELDIDYYKFNVVGAGNVRASLTNLPDDFDLYLCNSSGNVIARSINIDTMPEEINVNVTATGVYYLAVCGYASYSTAQKYSLLLSKAGVVPVTGVSLSAHALSLYAGDSTQLSATVAPAGASNKAVTWSSSNAAVAAVSSRGVVTGKAAGSATITVKTADGGFKDTCAVTVKLLAAPKPTAVSASYSSVKVSWAAVSGASGYVLYRSTSLNGTYALVTTTTATSVTNTGLSTGTTYYYKVRSYRNGTVRIYSGYSSATAKAPVPSAPTAKAAPATYNSIRLTWGAVAGATKYEVYRSTSQTGAYTLLTATTALSYANTNVNTGTTYYYKVRAYRLVGSKKVYGAYSVIVSAKTSLAAPTSVRAVRASSKSVKVTWGAVAGATKYELWRAAYSAGVYSLVTTTSGKYYTNTGLITGRTYYYKVRAYRLVSGRKVYGAYSAVVYAKP